MSDITKTLKEQLRDIHHAAYDTADALRYSLEAMLNQEFFLPAGFHPHQVTDTTTQQEVKS